jgi:hypothetical protein
VVAGQIAGCVPLALVGLFSLLVFLTFAGHVAGVFDVIIQAFLLVRHFIYWFHYR